MFTQMYSRDSSDVVSQQGSQPPAYTFSLWHSWSQLVTSAVTQTIAAHYIWTCKSFILLIRIRITKQKGLAGIVFVHRAIATFVQQDNPNSMCIKFLLHSDRTLKILAIYLQVSYFLLSHSICKLLSNISLPKLPLSEKAHTFSLKRKGASLQITQSSI